MPTGIEWCDEVWNPVTGCTPVSAGCKHCYADGIARRFWGARKFGEVMCHEDRLGIPAKWRKPKRIFVNSMSDLFHGRVPDWFIHEVLHVVRTCPRHTFIALTKRPSRMRVFNWQCAKYKVDFAALPNMILGVSCEDQATANERIPLLLQAPAFRRCVSLEPLLGPVSLPEACRNSPGRCWCGAHVSSTMSASAGDHRNAGIDWVIVGGETGHGARPCDIEWIRSVVEQCRWSRVPCFVKQGGGGLRYEHMYPALQVRQWPEVSR